MNEDPELLNNSVDIINVINLCCLCLQETKLEVISPENFKFIQFLSQMQINKSDVHRACSACLKTLSDMSTFTTKVRVALKGYIDLFKEIIVVDNAVDSFSDESDFAELYEAPESCPSLDDDSDQEEVQNQAVTPTEVAKEETLEEKIKRIMDDDSVDESSFVVEYLEEDEKPNKASKAPKPSSLSPKPKISCETCGKEFQKLSALKEHTRTHTGEMPFSCSHCDKKFKSRLGHKEHESTHTGDYPMFCSYNCGRGFHNKNTKTNHELSVHTNERPFACGKCEKRYSSKSALEDHIKCQHAPLDSAAHYCDVCGKRFPIKSLLNAHLRTHSDERRFKCQLCPSTFKHSSHLRDHEKTHGERKHMCTLCDRTFAVAQSLNRHMRYHANVKKFKCSWAGCSKLFVEKHDLTKHKRIHTGFKPHHCQFCKKGFANKDACKRHQSNHISVTNEQKEVQTVSN